MKTILIIYPHWHPANLAGVQRPRLIGNYLKELGWSPRILTVHPAYYEGIPDMDFEKTFAPDFKVTYVNAIPLNQKQILAAKKLKKVSTLSIYSVLTFNNRIRLFGDIIIRAFVPLLKGAQHIIQTEQIDFIWLPIPNFYNALLGRLLYEKTKVPYGIDYIDPWVRDISNQNNWRAKISQWFARKLEPIAIKKASLISGVSTPYYAPAIERNFPEIAEELLNQEHQVQSIKYQDGDSKKIDTDLPELTNRNIQITSKTPNTESKIYNPYTKKPITHVGMPYGFDPNDHHIKLQDLNYPWGNSSNKKIWLYAGAFLPNSHLLMDAFFKAIKGLRLKEQWDNNIQLWFIGTGAYPAKRITSYALDHQIDDIVFEERDRFPFLHVLNYLSAANTVMIIGSTEEHYTASKTYQSLLSERPVVSVFHHKSSAVKVMKECNADEYTVRYQPEMTFDEIVSAFKVRLLKRLQTDEWQPDLGALDQYSAKESTRKLVEVIERVI